MASGEVSDYMYDPLGIALLVAVIYVALVVGLMLLCYRIYFCFLTPIGIGPALPNP